MTHGDNYTANKGAMEALLKGGLDALPEMVRIIVNQAMEVERHAFAYTHCGFIRYIGVAANYDVFPAGKVSGTQILRHVIQVSNLDAHKTRTQIFGYFRIIFVWAIQKA